MEVLAGTQVRRAYFTTLLHFTQRSIAVTCYIYYISFRILYYMSCSTGRVARPPYIMSKRWSGDSCRLYWARKA